MLLGQSVPRREGRAKVTGRAQYVDDLVLPGMLFGATVRSAEPRGLIKRIEFGPDISWSDFVVVTAADIPGVNRVALIVDDQPCLAADRVNHPEEPVVLLAHADRHVLEEARRHVRIDLDPEPAVFTMAEALDGRAIVWGRDNIFKNYQVTRGDVDSAFASADLVVEGEYETGAQEQLYIEPNGMVATANRADGVTVWGSMQCPYYIHKALKALFNLPADKVRVVQMETGGGFGGKEEYPSIIACHAALLAWKSGKPVKLVYDRAEDMVATTKRHPSRTRHRTAVTRDGRLVAMDVDFVIDGGAYCTLSPVVLSRGTIHSAGPYLCPNVRLRGRAVATNAPPHGAFRGFGAPQSLFALERHMDRVAAAVGLAPDELRRRNFIRAGDTSAVGQVMRDPIDMGALLDRALAIAGYHAKRARFDEINPSLRVRKGIGLATFMHGAGFTGSGEDHLASVVALEAPPMAASVCCRRTPRSVRARTRSSRRSPPRPSACRSTRSTSCSPTPRSCPTAVRPWRRARAWSSGSSSKPRRAGSSPSSRRLASAIASLALDEFRRACADYTASLGPLRATARYQPPPGLRWDDETYQGDAYGTYAWAVYVAEVSVDTTTWETRVDDFVAVQEVGKVINPVLATGQIEGGVAQAIGWALYERVVWREGRMVNGEMTNYIMPTSMDLPPIRVFFEEQPYAYGPSGAKGIGELPMDGPAPAILNAVAHATGADPRAIPMTPEALMALMETAHV